MSGVHTWGDMSLAEMWKMGGATDFGGGGSGDQEHSGRTNLRRSMGYLQQQAGRSVHLCSDMTQAGIQKRELLA